MIPPTEDHFQLLEEALDDARIRIEILEAQINSLQERNSKLNREIIETVHQRETYKTEMFAYETSIKQLFEFEIGWRPSVVHSGELEAVLKTYGGDERELRGALLGLRRVWEIRRKREAVKARLAERESKGAERGDGEGGGEVTQAVEEGEVEKGD